MRAAFGQGKGLITLGGLNCTGAESSILECQYSSVNQSNCTHTNDVGVICQPGRNFAKYIASDCHIISITDAASTSILIFILTSP